MPQNLDQLVLRIRAETLRWNLRRAHETLENLPGLSRRLTEITGSLQAAQDAVEPHADAVRDYYLNKPAGTRERLKSAKNFMDELPGALGDIRTSLSTLEGDSFLHKIKQSGVETWCQALEDRAQELLDQIDLRGGTLAGLAAIERAAKDQVFVESVELLGGIALRDVRLNADICLLAERLLEAIRASSFSHYAMLGGLSSLLTRLDRVIRLPFPLWTLWDLPFAAHELWHVDMDRKKARERLRQKFGATILAECWADAFATYTVGPAYGYAAITLWFDPADPRFDFRVRMIRSMLRAMDVGSGELGQVYGKVAGDLALAWDGAVNQSRRAAANAAPPAASDEAIALYQALREELAARSADQPEPPGLREAAVAAHRRVIAPAAPIAAEPVADDAALDKICISLADDLNELGYKRFGPRQWGMVQDWRGVLEGDSTAHDLRHVLNAGWLARGENPEDKTLTAKLKARAERFLSASPTSTRHDVPAGADR